MSGTLFIVSIPIGNKLDISERALVTLQNSDLIVVEEFKVGKKFLDLNKIQKPIEELNEHNEKENSLELLNELLRGKNVSLISDCGTPVFSDPGQKLVKLAIQNKIKIVPVPGASSLLAALVVSGFNIDKFLFYGWLSPKKEVRQKELHSIKNYTCTLVLMDTPYRLLSLMEDVVKIFGAKRRLCLALDLTTERELVLHTSTGELLEKVRKEKIKVEFVLILEGLNS